VSGRAIQIDHDQRVDAITESRIDAQAQYLGAEREIAFEQDRDTLAFIIEVRHESR